MSTRRTAKPRLLPVVMVAATGLLILKVLGLSMHGGYVIAPEPATTVPGFGRSVAVNRANPDYTGIAPMMPMPPQVAGGSPRVEGSAFARGESAADQIITGSATPKKDEADKKDAKGKKDEAGKGGKDGKAEAPVQPLPPAQPSVSERQLLENLSSRRQQLDERTKELELREQMLKSAEKMLQDKIGDLKASETKIDSVQPKDNSEQALMRPVVVMYEAMKPRDAARVFEKMAPAQLAPLARQMNPRKLSEVISQMSPESAEKLTQMLMRPVAAPAAPKAPAADAPVPVEELPRLPTPKTPRS